MGGLAEYEHLDAIGLAALIGRREVTALEVIEAAVERAEKHNPAINAITVPLYERGAPRLRNRSAPGRSSAFRFCSRTLARC